MKNSTADDMARIEAGFIQAGVDFLLLPKLHLDINADYRFLNWEDLDNYDSDTITFGATVRVGF